MAGHVSMWLCVGAAWPEPFMQAPANLIRLLPQAIGRADRGGCMAAFRESASQACIQSVATAKSVLVVNALLVSASSRVEGLHDLRQGSSNGHDFDANNSRYQ